jgi:hypothetical protein
MSVAGQGESARAVRLAAAAHAEQERLSNETFPEGIGPDRSCALLEL